MEWRLVDVDYSDSNNWKGRKIIPRKYHDKECNNKLERFKDNLPEYYNELIKIYEGFPISLKPIEKLRDEFDVFIISHPVIAIVEYVNDSYIVIKENKNYPIMKDDAKAVIVGIESENDIKCINFTLV